MPKPFVEVDPHLWRGPQPLPDDFRWLSAQGLTGVVNLRAEAVGAFRTEAETAGLEYRSIPVVDWSIPTLEQVREFLALFEPGKRWLVHCLGGVGRTGVFVSCYRIARGWTALEAIKQTHLEVPLMSLNQEQREFVRAFEQGWREAHTGALKP